MKFRSLISLIVSKINSDSKDLAVKKISPMGLKLVLWYNAVRKDFFIQTYNSVGQSKMRISKTRWKWPIMMVKMNETRLKWFRYVKRKSVNDVKGWE